MRFTMAALQFNSKHRKRGPYHYYYFQLGIPYEAVSHSRTDWAGHYQPTARSRLCGVHDPKPSPAHERVASQAPATHHFTSRTVKSPGKSGHTSLGQVLNSIAVSLAAAH